MEKLVIYITTFNYCKPNSFLFNGEFNLMYGYCTNELLPYHVLKWVDTNIDVGSIPDGYFLVDWEYLRELHDLDRHQPFRPKHHTPPGSKIPKLQTVLHTRRNYIIHVWLNPFTDFNTLLRSGKRFQKTLFKFLFNAIYGKTHQNVKKHRVVKLVNK